MDRGWGGGHNESNKLDTNNEAKIENQSGKREKSEDEVNKYGRYLS